jgi:hypothetical protein
LYRSGNATFDIPADIALASEIDGGEGRIRKHIRNRIRGNTVPVDSSAHSAERRWREHLNIDQMVSLPLERSDATRILVSRFRSSP